MSCPNTALKISGGQNHGFVLVSTLIVLSLLMLLGSYFITSSLTDLRIARSSSAVTYAYHLAQAAAEEMISKLKNDPVFEQNFINGTLSEANARITRTAIFDNGSYEVAAQSTDPGVADIVATGRKSIENNTAKRVIKETVGRATGTPPSWALPLAAGGRGTKENGNITISLPMQISGGDIRANQNFKIKGNQTIVTVQNGNVKAANNIIVESGAELIITGGNEQEGVPPLDMPQVDFDSNLSTSFKNRATQTLTPAQFKALPDGSTLNGIIFVTGELEIKNQALTINGMLAVNDNLEIDNYGKSFTVNANTGGSGILAKNDITIKSDVTIAGIVYAADTLHIELGAHPTERVNITGGMVAWSAILEGKGDSLVTIAYDPALVSVPLDPTYNQSTPLLQINHWEEEY